MREKMFKKKNGITLIALIITIIVMLILVAVTITIAVNGGLFNYARNASVKTNEAMENEQLWASGSVIDYYLNRKSAVVGLTAYKELTEDDFDDDGCITKNASYESGMAIAPIPKGFKVSDKKDEQSIANGLVIQDADGNEFVWIPVASGTFTRTGWWNNAPTTDSLEDITDGWEEEDYQMYVAIAYGYEDIESAATGEGFDTPQEFLEDNFGTWEEFFNDCYGWEGALDTENYTETVPSDLTDSVSDNGGFYLARYEVGSETARTSSSGATEMVVQKGAYPYNYINWNDAKAKSEGMYTGDNYGVTSTLVFGAQWDSALRFVKDKVNVTNSTTWGNYYNHTFEFDGKYTSNPGNANPTWGDDETTKPNDTSWLLTTGASDTNKAKNIYDIAGNVWEWTMEANSTSFRVVRGGYYIHYGSSNPASYRYGSGPTNSYDRIGFRTALYVR